MTTEEILAKATPRPWRRCEPAGCKDDHGWSHHPCHDLESVTATWKPSYRPDDGTSYPTSVISSWGHDADGIQAEDVDIDLIVLAVNSYEKQRECISGLITEARQVINTFWETYEYRDKYTDNDCTKAMEHLEAALARAEELLK